MSNCKPSVVPPWLRFILVRFLWIVFVLAFFSAMFGCAALPDTVSIDASHTSHHWGDTRAPYEYGKDIEGISEHWNAGALKLDLSEYAQQCKDGLHPEFNARASYVIPISK